MSVSVGNLNNAPHDSMPTSPALQMRQAKLPATVSFHPSSKYPRNGRGESAAQAKARLCVSSDTNRSFLKMSAAFTKPTLAVAKTAWLSSAANKDFFAMLSWQQSHKNPV